MKQRYTPFCLLILTNCSDIELMTYTCKKFRQTKNRLCVEYFLLVVVGTWEKCCTIKYFLCIEFKYHNMYWIVLKIRLISIRKNYNVPFQWSLLYWSYKLLESITFQMYSYRCINFKLSPFRDRKFENFWQQTFQWNTQIYFNLNMTIIATIMWP